MKPAPFVYHQPRTRDEVDALLETHGGEAKILAGGQSLIPLLNMRLISPAHVIDVNELEDEPGEPIFDGDTVRFGPLVRHEAVERSPLVSEHLSLLRDVMRYVAHPPIRTRGTLAGSLAHADPASELPAAFVLLGGSVEARSPRGAREIAASELFLGPLETALEPDEWISDVRMTAGPSTAGAAIEEFARRHGDYALCGVVATAERANGHVHAALAYFGVGDMPKRLALGSLDGRTEDGDGVVSAVRELVAEHLDPHDDIHATARYRIRLAEKLGARAVQRAAAVAAPRDES